LKKEIPIIKSVLQPVENLKVIRHDKRLTQKERDTAKVNPAMRILKKLGKKIPHSKTVRVVIPSTRFPEPKTETPDFDDER